MGDDDDVDGDGDDGDMLVMWIPYGKNIKL